MSKQFVQGLNKGDSMKSNLSKLLAVMFLFTAPLCRSEINTNTLYLVLSNTDEGAINDSSAKAGIVSFTKSLSGKFLFNEVVQTMELVDSSVIRMERNRNIIVAKKDNPSSLQIVDTQFPEKVWEYKLRTHTKTATTIDHDNLVVIYETYPAKDKIDADGYSAKVFLLRTTDGHVSETNTSFWGNTIGFESFSVSDSIKYRRLGLNNSIYLPNPPEEFLKSNRQKIINRASTGDKIIYFFAMDSIGALQKQNCLWLYDCQTKSWSSDYLSYNAVSFRSFRNNLAVRHGSRNDLSHNFTYSGVWSLYFSGKKMEVFLGWDSNVLYLTNTTLIFNDSSRLYECDINEQTLAISTPRLIAEHNYIRYAKSLFFRNEE